jgi:large conductance mechanosensitive channel
MGLLSEFRAFVARGNVVDLAVGVVIGAAFGKIVSALVDGVVMPMLAMATGGVRVDQWKLVLKPAVLDAAGKVASPEVAVQYGNVLQATIDFLIIALVIFLVLRAYNRLRAPAVEAPAAAPEDVVLLREIRDLLQGRPSPRP